MIQALEHEGVDTIFGSIDADAALIQLNVADSELAQRYESWKPRVSRPQSGVLAK